MSTPAEILDALIARFEKSGSTEVEILVDMCHDHTHNELSDKGYIDSMSLVLLDNMFDEVISAAKAMQAELHATRESHHV